MSALGYNYFQRYKQALVVLLIGLFCVSTVQARDPCAEFYQLQKGRSYDVVKVEILGVQNGIAGLMVLGLPRNLQVRFNGIDIKRYKLDSRQIQCGRESVGELSSFDLRQLNVDSGVLEVQAGRLSDSRMVSLH